MTESPAETREVPGRGGALVTAALGLERKAVALLSGGLDSTLAVQAVMEQGIEVLALNFFSPFCTCSPRHGGCHMAREVAEKLGVKIRILDKGIEFLRVVERPRFGYGRGMNPCIDCRIFMLRKALGVLNEIRASFVVTGEVLGQRPMSQYMQALRLIEEESGLKGRILRPLSARYLEPTIPEKEGLIDRNALFSIRGRSRKEQLKMAREKGIELFSCPAGGCLLTDAVIARRMKDLFRHCKDYNIKDARMATLGRHFRLHDGLKVVMGRNEEENRRLLHAGSEFPHLELANQPGPLMVVRGEMQREDRDIMGRLLRFHAKKIESEAVQVRRTYGKQEETFLVHGAVTRDEVNRWRI